MIAVYFENHKAIGFTMSICLNQRYRFPEYLSGPPGKSQSYRCPRSICLDPLENHKATKPAFNVGPSSARQRNAILNGVSLVGH